MPIPIDGPADVKSSFTWAKVFMKENGAGPGQGLPHQTFTVMVVVDGHCFLGAVGCAESVISLLTNVSISCACVCAICPRF